MAHGSKKYGTVQIDHLHLRQPVSLSALFRKAVLRLQVHQDDRSSF